MRIPAKTGSRIPARRNKRLKGKSAILAAPRWQAHQSGDEPNLLSPPSPSENYFTENDRREWKRSGGQTSSAHDFHADRGNTGALHVQRPGGAVRQVDRTIAHEWTAIIDSDRHRASVLEIGDTHFGAERQAAVCGRKLMRANVLSGRGAPRVEARDPARAGIA